MATSVIHVFARVLDRLGSSSTTRLGKKHLRPRRSWTQEEEAVLISSLKDLIAQGWKSDNGFRAGYLNKLEEAMEAHFRNTDLKGFPHINSKLTTWKKAYYSLEGILSRSGVGFNSNGNNMIECEDETWEHIIKLDSNAKAMRRKPWPLYHQWKEIFGRDRATCEGAQDFPVGCDENPDEDSSHHIAADAPPVQATQDEADDLEAASDTHSSRNGKGPQVSSRSTNKKRKSSDELSQLCEILADFGKQTQEQLASIAEIIGYDAKLGQAAEKSFQELGKIQGLTTEQRFDVAEILSANVDKVKIFRGLNLAEKSQYVKRLLKNHRK